MDEPEFNDFPRSYRLSQRAMLAAITTLLFSRALAPAQWPVAAKWILAAVVVGLVVFALMASCYVVIRYPYLSLVQPRDGDIFSKQFTSNTLARLTKAFGLVTVLLLLIALVIPAWGKGIENGFHAVSLAYTAILFGVIVYLSFVYDAELHPTVATFIRATLGVGIVLVPLFVPVLAVGSIRCRRLLDAEASRQENET